MERIWVVAIYKCEIRCLMTCEYHKRIKSLPYVSTPNELLARLACLLVEFTIMNQE